MNGLNKLFMDNPVWFLQKVCVDNQAMQLGNAGAKTLSNLNQWKKGWFDLVPVGANSSNKVTLTNASPWSDHKVIGDEPIKAYWCPFFNGGDLPGWVDVERVKPLHRFVITAAMQGCCFAITDSPISAKYFRVFHNQHPERGATWQSMQQSGVTRIISTLAYEDYGNPSGADGGMTNAFNLLWRPPGKAWSYISQSNRFVPSAASATNRSYKPTVAIERDLAKPILDLPTGV